MLSLFVSAALAAAAPSPLESGEVRCILGELTGNERAGISRDALAGSTGTADLERLNAVTAACADRLGWSADDAGMTAAVAVSVIIRDEAAVALSRQRISAAAIDRWFAEQTDAVRINPNIDPADGERLVAVLHVQGTPVPVLEENGFLIGSYLGALVMLERIERGLPID